MRSRSSVDLPSVLYKALEVRFGLIVSSDDPDRLLRKLYPVRKSQAIFALLSFVRFGDEIWILKRGQPDDQITEADQATDE